MPLGYQSITQNIRTLNDGRDRNTVFQMFKNLLSVKADQASTPRLVLRPDAVYSSDGTPTSVSTAGNVTVTAAQMLAGIFVRDPNGAGRTDTFDTAVALVAAVPDAKVGDVIQLLIVNGADAAETITLAGGTGGTFDANQTAASRVIPQNTSKTVRIRLTNVTSGSEAYVIYA